MIIVLMGPAGAGKSTVGRALAKAVRWPFHDADDLHAAASIEKMRRGTPLDDEDRQPWLARVRALMVEVTERNRHAVVACSALRERSRSALTEGIPGVTFVMLAADRTVLERRLAARQNHFAGTSLLDSQLADLEVPPHALILSAAQPVDAIVREICAAFSLPCRAGPSAGR